MKNVKKNVESKKKIYIYTQHQRGKYKSKWECIFIFICQQHAIYFLGQLSVDLKDDGIRYKINKVSFKVFTEKKRYGLVKDEMCVNITPSPKQIMCDPLHLHILLLTSQFSTIHVNVSWFTGSSLREHLCQFFQFVKLVKISSSNIEKSFQNPPKFSSIHRQTVDEIKRTHTSSRD